MLNNRETYKLVHGPLWLVYYVKHPGFIPGCDVFYMLYCSLINPGTAICGIPDGDIVKPHSGYHPMRELSMFNEIVHFPVFNCCIDFDCISAIYYSLVKKLRPRARFTNDIWYHIYIIIEIDIYPSVDRNIHHKVWDEITYLFWNFNGSKVEFGEWIYNFVLHLLGPEVILYFDRILGSHSRDSISNSAVRS